MEPNPSDFLKPSNPTPAPTAIDRAGDDLFDWMKGERLKQEGMEKSAMSRTALLALARSLAVALAGEKDRSISIDDVQKELMAMGHDPEKLGNAAGSVFRGPRWEWAGVTHSRRTSNHRRMIKTWRLKS